MSRTHRSHSTVVAVPSHVSDALNDTQLVQLLTLKVGTRVLLQCNVAPRYRLVNGSVGIFYRFPAPPLELPARVQALRRRRRWRMHPRQDVCHPPTPDQGGAPPPPPSWVQQLLRRGGFGCGSDVLACVETFQAMDVESLWRRVRKQLQRRHGKRDGTPSQRCRNHREVTGTSCIDVGLGKAMQTDKGGTHSFAQPLQQQQQQLKRIPYGAFSPSAHYAHFRRILCNVTPPGSSLAVTVCAFRRGPADQASAPLFARPYRGGTRARAAACGAVSVAC